MTARKPKELHKKNGRPTSFKPEYVAQAFKLALLSATDVQLADFFEVAESTITKWKLDYPKFSAALKKGKDDADAAVVKSLYHRAIGYEHPAVKIITVARGNNEGADVQEVPYTEHYPPDTTAAIFWLKNRQSANWRDRKEVDLTSKGLSLAELLTLGADRADAG